MLQKDFVSPGKDEGRQLYENCFVVEDEGELGCGRMDQFCSTGTTAERLLSSVIRKSSK